MLRWVKEPLDGGTEFDGFGDDGAGRKWVEKDEQGPGIRKLRLCLDEGADFALEGGGVAGIGADLDEQDVSGRIDGVEVHFVALGRAEVVDLAAAAEEFDEDGGFKRAAEVGAAHAFVDRDEAGIDGIGLARVHHALALGRGEERGRPDEEGILEVGEEGMEIVLGNGEALGFQRIVEFLDAERGGRVSQEMALEPAEGDGIGNGMTLDDVPQDGDIDVALQERPTVAHVDILGVREAAFGQIGAEGFFEGGAAGLGQGVPGYFRQEIAMEECLAEAERKYGDLHRPSAHAGVDLAAEHGGR